MTTSDPETATLQAAPADTAAKPKATTKAHTAPRKPRVVPAKGKSGKRASKAEKGAKKPKGAKPPKVGEGPREGSKAAKVLDLLKRPDGATLNELIKATGWQPHSVRGYLSGTVGKKLGLKVESTKAENGERSYSVKA
jgi:Protein of unknown function (DUF3489)